MGKDLICQPSVLISEKTMRVRVHSGDMETYLGEGTFVGNVTVYYIETAEGISSLENAEVPPPSELVPEGANVLSLEDNPKIVLDNGDVVYGCQVWWDGVTPEDKQKIKEMYETY